MRLRRSEKPPPFTELALSTRGLRPSSLRLYARNEAAGALGNGDDSWKNKKPGVAGHRVLKSSVARSGLRHAIIGELWHLEALAVFAGEVVVHAVVLEALGLRIEIQRVAGAERDI